MATKRSRIGHRLLLKMGLRREGTCPTFDLAHENYTWLKHYVEEMRESLSTYALQLARMTEAARGVGDDASHIYLVRDKGFKPVVAFKEAQDKGHNGYAGQLQQAFVKGIIEPISQWHKDLESMEVLVVDFNDIRIQHDHYRLKVEDLTQKAKALEARATTRGDSREAKAAAEKLKRNTAKLNDVTKEFDKRLSLCCDRMTAAWDEREKMMNGIVARIIHFQESFFGEMLMCGLGVSRILRDAEGSGPRWGGTSGIEPFVPKGHIRHYEGELVRKHTLIKERLWYRLVGSSLEVYDVKTKEDEPLYVVTEAPIEVWEVKGIARMSPVNFRVTVLAGPDGGLNLFAADEVDGQGWWEALTRASEWDQLASASKVRCVRQRQCCGYIACVYFMAAFSSVSSCAKPPAGWFHRFHENASAHACRRYPHGLYLHVDRVEAQVSESRAFLKRCKIAHANTTTVVGLEKELGVTEALANPPPPPADRPDAKGYTLVNANDKKKGGGGGPGGGPGGLPAGLTGGLGAGGMSGGIGGIGPAIMLPPGMLPTGGWGGPPQASSWGAGSGAGVLPQSRSFGSRFGGRKPAGARQQGFRRSNSFGDQYMGPGGAAFPGGRAFDDMMQPGPLSPMMEDDGFDTHSTRSAPAWPLISPSLFCLPARALAAAVALFLSRSFFARDPFFAVCCNDTPPLCPHRSGICTRHRPSPSHSAAMAASTRVAAGVHDLNDLPKDTGTEETKSSPPRPVLRPRCPPCRSRRRPPRPLPWVGASPRKRRPRRTPGDDGGLSRYGLSGETPARTRSRPTPTWKRMMSLGGSSSSRSYRYDGGDMGVSGEAKPSAEEEAPSATVAATIASTVAGTFAASKMSAPAATASGDDSATKTGVSPASSGSSSGASSPTSVASTRATVGAPTPVAGGCDSITPALFAALGAATAPSPKKTASPPAVPEITAAPAKTSSAPAGSSSMSRRTAASTAPSPALTLAAIAAQAKVFQRLCDSSGSEAETGDAGGGGGAGSPSPTLSFQQLMGWDEVQELLEYGALKEEELTSLLPFEPRTPSAV
ncbi:unnamed protein product [Scytosiphon promiscuus]